MDIFKDTSYNLELKDISIAYEKIIQVLMAISPKAELKRRWSKIFIITCLWNIEMIEK